MGDYFGQDFMGDGDLIIVDISSLSGFLGQNFLGNGDLVMPAPKYSQSK